MKANEWASLVISIAGIIGALGGAFFNYRHTEQRFRASAYPALRPSLPVGNDPNYRVAVTILDASVHNLSDRVTATDLKIRVSVAAPRPWWGPRRWVCYREEEWPDLGPGADHSSKFPEAEVEGLGGFEHFLESNFPRHIRALDTLKRAPTQYYVHAQTRFGLRLAVTFVPGVHEARAVTVRRDSELKPVSGPMPEHPEVLLRFDSSPRQR